MMHPHDKTPKQRRLEQFLQKIAHIAGVGAPKLVPTLMTNTVADEGYVPQFAADQSSRRVLLNTASPQHFGPGVDTTGLSPREASGAMAQQEQYRKFAIAHELGHLAERDYVRGPAGVLRYLAATGQRDRPLADPAVLARAGASVPGASPTDQWGMPTQGPGTTHTAPNEQYATDFAASLGHGFGSSMTPSSTAALRELMREGLVPKGRKGWDERGSDATRGRRGRSRGKP